MHGRYAVGGQLDGASCPGGRAVGLPLILADVFSSAINPAEYWVSEKLDGIRAYWDGSQLFFRSGHPIQVPAWYTAGFQNIPLDGEFWLGRGRFEHLSGIVRKGVPVDAEWRQIRFMLFELPDAPGTFTERKDRLVELAAAAGVPWFKAVEQQRVADGKSLQDLLSIVVAGGGEGLMLHRAEAPFASGRSADLLKLKPFLDSEARVIGHLNGKGRHHSRLGALIVATQDGKEFRIGTGFTDEQRENPPPVGAVVTYRYQGVTANGLPRFPVFLHMREEW